MRNLFRLIAAGDRRRGEIPPIRWMSTFSPKIPFSGSWNPKDNIDGVLTRSRVSAAEDYIPRRYRVPQFGGQILYSRTAPEVESAAREIIDTIEVLKQSNDTIHAGFDLEWKPSFILGKSPGKAAVIQICLDPVRCYVMHIFHSGITPGLRELLENSVFTKVGVAIHNDACKVLRDHGVKIHDLMDLSSLANLKFGGIARSWGIRSLTKKLLSIQLKKCNLVQLGNWEAIELSRSQQEYAAADAVASLRIHQVLKSLPDATKGDELIKRKLKVLKSLPDATKGDDLKKKKLEVLKSLPDAPKGDGLKKKNLKVLKSLPDATKGDELKKKLKTDATKGDELKKNKLKTDATKSDELKKKKLKTDATKGDELKGKKIEG